MIQVYIEFLQVCPLWDRLQGQYAPVLGSFGFHLHPVLSLLQRNHPIVTLLQGQYDPVLRSFEGYLDPVLTPLQGYDSILTLLQGFTDGFVHSFTKMVLSEQPIEDHGMVELANVRFGTTTFSKNIFAVD